MTYRPVVASMRGTLLSTGGTELPPYAYPIPKDDRPVSQIPHMASYSRDGIMMQSIGESDYLAPQTDVKNEDVDDVNSVQYWILEDPAESNGRVGKNMSDEMYQSIHLNNSLSSNKV